MIAHKDREPAVAGRFYPADPHQLRQQLQKFLAEAQPEPLTAVRALISPHAGYIFSGPVAAYAYKTLQAQATPPTRIFLLGPAHLAAFKGIALPAAQYFRTPLGRIPIDNTALAALKPYPMFKTLPQAHAPEHCLEVQLPFLQAIGWEGTLVPLLFGQVDPHQVAEQLLAIWKPDDAIIISSDLSHYHTNDTAHTRDKALLTALLAANTEAFSLGEACGQAPMMTLMHIAQHHHWQPHLLDYRTSGDVQGDTRRVVGYAAIAYTASTEAS